MPHLALHFLGSPLIELQGVPVVIVRRKAIALLAYLAVTKRRRSREHLANLFWPDGDAAKRAGSVPHPRPAPRRRRQARPPSPYLFSSSIDAELMQ